jgi:hypothetical protein
LRCGQSVTTGQVDRTWRRENVQGQAPSLEQGSGEVADGVMVRR